MTERYRFAWRGGTGELTEKKSRFIATLAPVRSEEEALDFIEQTKKQYWDARHNCTAFTVGSRHQLTRCSDDGEPAGTAGRPMLEVLLGEDIHDVCVVVTRYFGGTLLGTGGLVRAYSGAVREALKASVILERQRGVRLSIHTDYGGAGKIQYLIGQNHIPILDSSYTDSVLLNVPRARRAFSLLFARRHRGDRRKSPAYKGRRGLVRASGGGSTFVWQGGTRMNRLFVRKHALLGSACYSGPFSSVPALFPVEIPARFLHGSRPGSPHQ